MTTGHCTNLGHVRVTSDQVETALVEGWKVTPYEAHRLVVKFGVGLGKRMLTWSAGWCAEWLWNQAVGEAARRLALGVRGKGTR